MKIGLSIAILLLVVSGLAACDGGVGATNKAGATDCVLDSGALDACTLN